MPKHSLLAASSSARWLTCTKSARFEEGLPNKSSGYAIEGTLAHAVAEVTASYWLGKTSEQQYEEAIALLRQDSYYSDEMRSYANEYAHFIVEKMGALEDPIAELEVHADYSEWAPEGAGTCDCAIISERVLEIIDYKYGQGERVSAESNSQMRCYALGAYVAYNLLYDIDTIRMTIYQPRISDGISSEEISIEDLLKWADKYVKPRALLAFSGEGEFVPSAKACRFCKGAAVCKARAAQNLALFDDAPDINVMSSDEVGAYLEKADDIKAWLKALEDHIFNAILQGDEVKGWKLVHGRSNRAFSDEAQVVKALTKAGYNKKLLYEQKLLTLTQLEKAFGKKEIGEVLKDLIVKPDGKPTLVPAFDKRQPYQPTEELLKQFDKEEK